MFIGIVPESALQHRQVFVVECLAEKERRKRKMPRSRPLPTTEAAKRKDMARTMLMVCLLTLMPTVGSATVLNKPPFPSTCSGWVALRLRLSEFHPLKDPTHSDFLSKLWSDKLQRYLSETVRVTYGDYEMLLGTDPIGLDLWMDDYCRSHPDHYVVRGGYEWIKELKARQKGSAPE